MEVLASQMSLPSKFSETVKCFMWQCYFCVEIVRARSRSPISIVECIAIGENVFCSQSTANFTSSDSDWTDPLNHAFSEAWSLCGMNAMKCLQIQHLHASQPAQQTLHAQNPI
jgi:hypothetical protein